MSEGHETRIRELEIGQGKIITTLDHLTDAIEGLTEKVGALNDTMNQGKGALSGGRWLLGVVAAIIGAVISWAMTLYQKN